MDTQSHVITHAQTVLAEGKDGDCLKALVNTVGRRLGQYDLKVKNMLCDGSYSSGENYQFLEQRGITAYIPLLGGALSGSEGFHYEEAKDHYICPAGKVLKGSGRLVDDGRGHPVRKYFSLISDCKTCPLKQSCIGLKAKQKKVQHSYYREQLERAGVRAVSEKGQWMKRKRSATVEPVWGTLINYTSMKRLNARGLAAANKCLLLAAAVYNLKKWMKQTFAGKRTPVIAKRTSKAKSIYSFIIAQLRVIRFTLYFLTPKPASLKTKSNNTY